VTLAVLTNDAI